MTHVPNDPALGLIECPPEFEALILSSGVPWSVVARGGVLHEGVEVRDAILHAMVMRWNGERFADWSPSHIGNLMRVSPDTVLRAAERHQCRLEEIEAAYALAFGPKPGQPRPCDGDGHGFDTEAEGPIFRLAGRPGLGRGPDGRFDPLPHMKAA